MRIRKPGLQLNGLPERGDRFRHPALTSKHRAQVAVSLAVVCAAGDRSLNALNRRLALADLLRDPAEKMPGGHIARIHREHLAVDLLSLWQASCLMMADGSCDGFSDGRHVNNIKRLSKARTANATAASLAGSKLAPGDAHVDDPPAGLRDQVWSRLMRIQSRQKCFVH